MGKGGRTSYGNVPTDIGNQPPLFSSLYANVSNVMLNISSFSKLLCGAILFRRFRCRSKKKLPHVSVRFSISLNSMEYKLIIMCVVASVGTMRDDSCNNYRC